MTVDPSHPDSPVEKPSERYEMHDLFTDEAPENQHFLKVTGLLILVLLLVLALAYPFLVA